MKKLSDWHLFSKCLLIAFFTITAGTISAQAPTITSFSPASGQIGTNVRINGTNFSTTASSNIVWFGATQAAVISASATQLLVTVPIGATYQPISVTVSGNTAYTNAPFSVTFPSSQVIDATAFAAKVDFIAGTNPRNAQMSDIDGDGKPDLVITNNGSNSISVFKNISTSGSISASSFATKVDFTTGTGPYGFAIGDIDGDGKPDIVVTNFTGNTVSVFKNTSTSGSITAGSFASKVDFVTGTGPINVGIGDIDGDGKPDLIVANYSSSTVSIFRNTSTLGSITIGSFAAKVDFTTGTTPFGIAYGDIDSDGKPDLVVTNINSNSVSVFRNTSTLGTISASSFAAKVDFTTGTGPYGVAIVDIDGDGKPDISVANSASNTVSIYRNISTSGSITLSSFAAKVDFTTGSVPVGVAFCDIDGDNKRDLIINNQTSNTVSIFRNTSTLGSIGAGSFATKVDFTTGNLPNCFALGDIDGDGKPDLVVANYNDNTISVLRNTISLPSYAVTFQAKMNIAMRKGRFTPATDSVIVRGYYNGWTANTDRLFDLNADSIYTGTIVVGTTTPSEYKFVIRHFSGDDWESHLSSNRTYTVSSNAQTLPAVYFDNDSLMLPVISGFIPLSGPVGTSVTISGKNFSATPANNIVWFGAVQANVTSASATQLIVTVPAGATYQPFSVTVNGYTDYASSAFNVTFPSTQTIDATSLTAKVDFTSGTNPTGTAFGDIDGDGKPDLVVANSANSTISIYRNTSTSGSIAAGSFATKVDFSTGTNPYGVAIGDIDGDGKPDVIVVNNNSSGTISVFKNTSTSGSITTSSLAAKVDFAAGANSIGVAIGDIDGDGKPDLAVTNLTGNSVSVFRNTSISGTINAGSFTAKVDLTTGSSPTGVAILDIDGDGKPELAITNSGGSSISVFRNISTSGAITAGSFAPKVDFTTGTGPYNLVFGDIDGDGKPDLAVVNQTGNTVSVFRNTSTSGSITISSLAAKIDFATGTSPYSIAIGDIDGDGKPDLVVPNYTNNTVSVIKNTSTSGSITASSFAAKVDFTTGSNPYGVIVGDIDGDGKPDIAVSDYSGTSLSVFRNNIPSGLTPTITSFTPSSGQAGTTVTINGTNFSATASNNIVWFGAVKASVLSASATQLTVKVPVGATYQPICVTNITNNLSAFSSSPFLLIFPSSQVIDATSMATKVDIATGTNPYFALLSDFDGDGKPDLITSNTSSNTISIYRNISSSGSLSAASFASKIDISTSAQPYGIAVGDFDGDGKPDLAISDFSNNTVSVLRNISTPGSIHTTRMDFATGYGPTGIAIGDIDGDGKPDIIVANQYDNTISVLRNTSTSGALTSGSFATKVDIAVGTYPVGVVVGDIDGDGKPDICVANSTSNTISVLRNISTSGSITTGSFAPKVDFNASSGPAWIAIGDIDGDGKPDIEVTNQISNSLSVFRNTSTSGSITSSSLATKVDLTTGINPYGLTISDIDGDAKPDIVVANGNSNSISIFKNISTSGTITTSSFSAKADFTTGTKPYGVFVGDIDGDNKPDIITGNFTSSTVSIFRNTISGPPIISSFTPTSGPVGTSMTINGNNFSTIAANNAVWFGAVQATVTSATATQLKLTVPVGATYQPISVTVSGLTDYSATPFNVTFPTNQVIDATTLASKVDFLSGTNPYGAALADIDGDGKADLIVANSGSGSISVYRNTSTSGSISTGSFGTKVDFTTGTNPYFIAVGDLDGDGKPDIAVINNGSNTVSVFRNTSSSGSITTSSLASKVDFPTGSGPYGIALGDIDGDGKPDIITTNYSANSISVLRNTGISGSMTSSSFATKVDFTTGSGPYNVAVGDIDGDGKPDLAVVNYIGNSISLFRNTSISFNISSGSFATRVDISSANAPRSVAIADIDGDGKPDLITANFNGNSFSVFRNISSSGSITAGSFATKTDFTAGTGPNSLAIGDLDGDGKPDVAITNGGSGSGTSVSIFKNSSSPGSITSGSFGTKIDFTTGSGPLGVVIGDIDGDGKPDLAATNYSSTSVSVFRNTTTLLSVPTITSFTPLSGPVGSSVTITGTNFSTTAANNIVWFGATKGTVTAATATQLIVTVPQCANYQPLSVTVNGMTDYSNYSFNVTFTSSQIINSLTFLPKVDLTAGSTPMHSAIADLDGDGKPDLVVVNNTTNTVSVYRNISTSGTITSGSFAAKVDFATGTGPFNVALADIDGDGKPDILVVNNVSNTVSVLRNTATSGSITSSSFAAKVDFATGTAPTSVAVSDIDGDGRPDIAVTNNSSSTVSLLRNTSASGSITTNSFATKIDFATGTNPYATTFTDVDGDGKPDLLVTCTGSNSLSVYRNISSYGSITSSSFTAKVDFTTGTSPYNLTTGDIDGDGFQDIVVTNYGSNTLSVFSNTGQTGGITTSSLSPKVDFITGNNPFDVAIGDFDGDGKPDISITNYTDNTMSVFQNTSTSGSINSGSLGTRADFTAGTAPIGISAGDIDGDGKPDIVLANSGGSLSVFRNNIALKILISSFTPTSGAVGATVTINGANFSPAAANNAVWFGAVKATVSAASASQLTVTVPVGATYQPISVTNISIGSTAYSSVPFNTTFLSSQIIDVNAFTTKVDFTTPAGSYYSAIADIDGDGKPDLIVSDYTANTISIFRNTGSSGSITTGSFANKVDFNTGNNPFGIAVGDIDGDGKPDIVVANYTSGTVSVFRNTSTSGSITTSSLATKVDFTAGSNPSFVAIGDIDGDGKPDLAVSNYSSSTVSLFQNTGTSGAITTSTFAAKVDFNTGSSPNGISIGDIDGDGKPDLIVANYFSNTISVFRNTSIFGSINTTSLAAKVDFATGSRPNCLALGDIDGDGKTDICVTNYTSNSVSVFRNISTSGTISSGSLAARYDYSTGTSPYSIAVCDLDGDGKPDVAVTNYSSSTLSVFKNNSTSGTIGAGSLAIKSDYATGTNPMGIGLADLDGDGKPDLIAVNYNGSTVSVLRNNMQLPPTTPTVGTITQPTCKTATGSVALSGLPSTGNWTVTRSPGGITTSGTGTSTVVSGISPGTYTFTVSTTANGTSAPTASVIITAVPKGVIPKIKAKWSDLLICFNLGDSIATYQWYISNSAIANATSQTYLTHKQAGTYKVYTTDNNGCSNFSTTVVITGTKGLSIYPNPAKESITVTMSDEQVGKAVITFINQSGRKVMEVETEKDLDDLIKEIPISNLDQGIYFVRVSINRQDAYYTKIMIIK